MSFSNFKERICQKLRKEANAICLSISMSISNQPQIITQRIGMLKFLQNQCSNRLPVRPLLRYDPSLVYGHTKQTPEHFTNTHTVFFQKKQPSHSSLKHLSVKIGEGFLKNESPNIKEQFQAPSKRIRSSRRSASGTINFNLTRGQFTNFLDDHKHYGSVGTIYKDEGPARLTKHKFNWNRSNNSSSKGMPIKSIISDNHTSIVGSIPSETNQASIKISTASKFSTLGFSRSNSISLLQKFAKKQELRVKREQFISLIKQQTRMKLDHQKQKFGLPKLGVSHEIFLLQKQKQRRELGKTQEEQINEDLAKFQKSLFQKLK